MVTSGPAIAQTATPRSAVRELPSAERAWWPPPFVANFVATCSHSTGSNLARQIVAAVHQFERHSIALVTIVAKGFADFAPHREPESKQIENSCRASAQNLSKRWRPRADGKGSEKNNCFAERQR